MVATMKSGITWEDIEEESENVQRNEFILPKEQYRNQGYDEIDFIDNAMDLLYDAKLKHFYDMKGTLVYHGGRPLDKDADYEDDRVFFVSLNKKDAENYITEEHPNVYVYRIVKAEFPVYQIHWDQLAASYGFDVDISKYSTVEEFDNAIDMSHYSDKQKEAEREAQKILTEYAQENDEEFAIGSWQDEEIGFLPTLYDAIEFVGIAKSINNKM